ncbi:natural cytotoxicity triggering receptor 3-like isoform X2 [Acipenser ruthenus]|uniref:natural cytotoxicity triggering receptor 3-like isoform X2 n=1 Tax=Acipenser ruthenus TaxID=7906 RepID=UPI00274171AB|nr:natural cytotoxicity triggering receptor 3-like isoform X2 [Acipenser ruthenus]
MNATVGEDVVLNCTFKSSSTVGSANWYKDGVNISNVTQPYRGRLVFSSTNSFKAKDASLKIVNVSVSDSGNYTCQVEALGDSAGCGSGTLLVVGPKRIADKSDVLDVSIWTIIPVAVAVFTVIIIVIISLCFVLQRRDQRRTESRREGIYQNVGTGNVQLNSILAEEDIPQYFVLSDEDLVYAAIDLEEPTHWLSDVNVSPVIYSALREVQ